MPGLGDPRLMCLSLRGAERCMMPSEDRITSRFSLAVPRAHKVLPVSRVGTALFRLETFEPP